MVRDSDLVERELGHRAADFTLKRAYASKAYAKRAKKASYQQRADSLHPYRCHVCDQWHLGNTPKGGYSGRVS